jgi:putative transposase
MSLERGCKLLGITRSSLYYKAVIGEDRVSLCNQIHEIYMRYPYYGYRKITAVLRYEGCLVNHKRVQKLMQEMGLQAIYPKPNLSKADEHASVFPYLLKGMTICFPNQVWAIDITYIRLPVGMVYLFALIDWYSRFIVGWTLANTMTSDHGIEALNMALVLGKPVICNADQGSQFTGEIWIGTLQTLQIAISHDGVGRCIDNVRIERFWRTIKYEDVHLNQYQTLKDARLGLKMFIEHYNYHRPHQALNYERPADIYFKREEYQNDEEIMLRNQLGLCPKPQSI